MHPVPYSWRGAEDGALTAKGNLQAISNVSCVLWDAGIPTPAL